MTAVIVAVVTGVFALVVAIIGVIGTYLEIRWLRSENTEQHGDGQDKIDAVSRAIGALDGKLDAVNTKVDQLDAKVSEQFREQSEQLTLQEVRIDQLEKEESWIPFE